MNYCPSCGSSIALLVPADDTRLRHVCSQCKEVHYRNPRNVVGTIPIWENQVLLCRRAIEPRHGYWTLPAGFLEIGESTAHGAIRETMEEAGAEVEIQSLYSLLNVVHVEQVHLFYLAQMRTPQFAAGTESLEVALFTEENIPWTELAFPTVKQTLQWYFADARAGHLGDLGVRTRNILPGERIG